MYTDINVLLCNKIYFCKGKCMRCHSKAINIVKYTQKNQKENVVNKM